MAPDVTAHRSISVSVSKPPGTLTERYEQGVGLRQLGKDAHTGAIGFHGRGCESEAQRRPDTR